MTLPKVDRDRLIFVPSLNRSRETSTCENRSDPMKQIDRILDYAL